MSLSPHVLEEVVESPFVSANFQSKASLRKSLKQKLRIKHIIDSWGYGAKLTNIYSKTFVVETADSSRQLLGGRTTVRSPIGKILIPISTQWMVLGKGVELLVIG